MADSDNHRDMDGLREASPTVVTTSCEREIKAETVLANRFEGRRVGAHCQLGSWGLVDLRLVTMMVVVA